MNTLGRNIDGVQTNKTSALILLNTIPIKEGELITIRYNTPTGQVDSLLALGVADGVGPKYYSLVSDQSCPVIYSILTSRPDISQMIYGAVYLVYDEETDQYKRWFTADGESCEEDLVDNFYFMNLEDRCYYYYDPAKFLIKIPEPENLWGGGVELGELKKEIDDLKNNSSSLNERLTKLEEGSNLSSLLERIETLEIKQSWKNI